MLRTDKVIELLQGKKHPMPFESIWKKIKEDTISSISKDMDETGVKAALYMSLLEDQRLIMVGDNNWDVKEKYSHNDQVQIEKIRVTEEIQLDLEESDETRELKLKIIPMDGEE